MASALRLADLSVLNPPPPGWIMVMLKGYFDDSGDDVDTRHQACSMGGYVGTADDWRSFDEDWTKALGDKPHLHMKEFGDPDGPYAEWRGKPDHPEMIAFFQRLTGVIAGHSLRGFGSTVRVRDLKRFNKERGLHIDAYSLALYGCLVEFFLLYPDTQAEIFVDHFRGARAKVDRAEAYTKSDAYYLKNREYLDAVQIAPLAKKIGFKKVLPIQAADFAVWEMRKSSENKNRWFNETKPNVEPKDWPVSLWIWRAQNAKGKPIEFPGGLERRSYRELLNAAPTEGHVWDYRMLDIAHEARGGVWPDEVSE